MHPTRTHPLSHPIPPITRSSAGVGVGGTGGGVGGGLGEGRAAGVEDQHRHPGLGQQRTQRGPIHQLLIRRLTGLLEQ
jgi:hypothetical protein